MSVKTADTYGPHIHRSVRAVWRVVYRWGTSFGDTTEYSISADGKSVTLNGFKDGTLLADVVKQIGEAMIAAAAWSDPSGARDTDTEAVSGDV